MVVLVVYYPSRSQLLWLVLSQFFLWILEIKGSWMSPFHSIFFACKCNHQMSFCLLQSEFRYYCIVSQNSSCVACCFKSLASNSAACTMGVHHLIQGCRLDVSCKKKSIFHVKFFCVPLLILSSKSAAYMMDVSI